jgi:4-alpha-glucanotransferase
MRKAVKQENPEALLLGEVWEDASNKFSYGTYRDFLFGGTHDSIMGYPFRRAVTGWLSGSIDASEMRDMLETLRENYPAEVFYCSMNLIGSHDVPRVVTELAGDRQIQDRESQSKSKLTPEQRFLGEKLLRLAMMIQFTYPGTPSVYYGDELAMEGYSDPFNRRTFPWRIIEEDSSELRKWLRELIRFRKMHPLIKTGFLTYENAKTNLIAYRRFYIDGKDAFGNPQSKESDIVVVINRSGQECQLDVGGKPIVAYAFSGMILQDGICVFHT